MQANLKDKIDVHVYKVYHTFMVPVKYAHCGVITFSLCCDKQTLNCLAAAVATIMIG